MLRPVLAAVLLTISIIALSSGLIAYGVFYQPSFTGMNNSDFGFYSGWSTVFSPNYGASYSNFVKYVTYPGVTVAFIQKSNTINVTMPPYSLFNASLPVYFLIIAPTKTAYFDDLFCKGLARCHGTYTGDNSKWNESLLQRPDSVFVNQTLLYSSGFKLVITLSEDIVGKDHTWGDTKFNFTIDTTSPEGDATRIPTPAGYSGTWTNLMTHSLFFKYYGEGFSEVSPAPLDKTLDTARYSWNLTTSSLDWLQSHMSILGSTSGQAQRELLKDIGLGTVGFVSGPIGYLWSQSRKNRRQAPIDLEPNEQLYA